MLDKKYVFVVFVFLIPFLSLSCQSLSPQNIKQDPTMLQILKGFSLPEKEFVINDTGKEDVLDYTEYGTFVNLGEKGYQYEITNEKKLNEDLGVGIFPNYEGVQQEPNFKVMFEQGLLNEHHWKILTSKNKQQAFYTWAMTNEEPGVKAFFTARILEESGHMVQAIKSYYSAVVHFPKSVGWGQDQSFVWYIAPAAIGQIKRLCRDYPELNLEYVDAMFDVENGGDTDLSNDIITLNPGRFIKKDYDEKLNDLPQLDSQKVVDRRGTGRVQLIKYANGHWQMRVDDKPFIVKGMTYGPTEIGIGPQNDFNFDQRWMFRDKNQNKKIDAPYEAWVDKNKNGQQDKDEPNIGDFQILKDMGLNAIRLYIPNKTSTEYDPSFINKELLRDLYNSYGISIIAGDFLGAYTVGSGADWLTGTDYRDEKQRAVMKEIVRQKVLDLKDEPFVLMWLLGNENNMPVDNLGVNATRTNAELYPERYAQFLNEVAAMIHELDPNHPVAVGNLGTGLMEYYDQYASEIDILGVNSYPGKSGFGTLWGDVKRKFDRPVLITEYGADVYDENLQTPNEEGQRDYYLGNLRDIVFNQAGGLYEGNAIGGVVFEYLDEWWKDSQGHSVFEQQHKPQFSAAFFDGYDHEEWFGIVGQGSGDHSPFERRLRETYYMFKSYWNSEDREE